MKKLLLGVVIGVVGVFLTGLLLMSSMGRYFFVEDQSVLPFDETVLQIRDRIQTSKTWHLLQEKDFNAAYKKKGEGELPFRLVEFKVGNPEHSYRVNKRFPAISTFMPASIAVVEYEPGNVIIYRKNTGLMGLMFSGDVRQVMQKEVPRELDDMLRGIIDV